MPNPFFKLNPCEEIRSNISDVAANPNGYPHEDDMHHAMRDKTLHHINACPGCKALYEAHLSRERHSSRR